MTVIPPLLQDADRKLSKALAGTPGARLHAKEAAAAIAADTPAGVAADPRKVLMMGDEPDTVGEILRMLPGFEPPAEPYCNTREAYMSGFRDARQIAAEIAAAPAIGAA